MCLVSRELEKLSRELLNAPEGRYGELYAAQQALSWALDPQAFKSPFALIMGTQEATEGCPVCRDQPQSSDTFDLAA